MEKVTIEIHADTCKEEIRKAIIAGLYEGGGEILSQVIRNTRVDTGQLKNSWQCKVDEDKLEATIGSPLENAIWEEFGTGEYALNGDGRKGGWYVPAEELSAKAKTKMQKRIIKGKEFYFTKGKKPSRALSSAFTAKKRVAEKAIKRKLKEME